MSDYTPTTEEVREVFCTPITLSQTLSEEFHWEVSGQFDRWLASVKAEAWDEGAESAYYDPEIRDQVNYPDNPYREQETP